MATWTTRKLKDITTKIGSGATPRGGQSSYKTSGLPLIRSLNIYDLQFDYDKLAFIDNKQAEDLSNVEVLLDDVLLNITGASVCRCTSVPDRLVPARVNQHVSIVRADGKNLDGKYLKYALVSPRYKRQLMGLATTGATREALTKDDIEKFELRLPDITTQIRIASILSAYDELIANNEKRIKVLEKMAQRLYTEWFVKFQFPGHEKVKLIDRGTEYGSIPEGWEVRNLGSIAKDRKNSINPLKANPVTPYVGLEHIPRKSIVLSNWGYAREISSNKLMFSAGDILFGKIRPYFHKVVIAPVDGIASSDTIIIVSMEEKYRTLILMHTSSDNFVAYATTTSQGSKMPRADWKTLTDYQVIVPRDDILMVFNSIVVVWIQEMNKLMMTNRAIQKIRDLLVPHLITGRRVLN